MQPGARCVQLHPFQVHVSIVSSGAAECWIGMTTTITLRAGS